MGRQFFIDGTEILVDPRWSIQDKINARSTASFVVVALGALSSINVGESFEIKKDVTTTIFKGIVKNADPIENDPGFIDWIIKIADNSAKADKLLIADTWENIASGDLVKDIIAQKLYLDGVTEGTIQDGPILKKVVSPYHKCSQLLEDIKDLTGFVWNIDFFDQLNYYQRSAFVAPFTLNDKVQHEKFRVSNKMDQYANTIYTRGGLGETPEQPNELPGPAPDGDTRTFTLRFPVARKPVIEVNINDTGWVAIDPADIGINGIDEDGSKKWYFTYNSQTITQDKTEAVLLPPSDSPAYNGDKVRVTYTGLRQIFVTSNDPVEVANRAAIEAGTSGIYERLLHNDNIVTAEQGIDYTQGQLALYAQVDQTVTFYTNVPGLRAGMLLPIDKPLFGIKGDYLIESITTTPFSPNEERYFVKALSGAILGGWEKFFAKIVDAGREFVIGENEVIIILQTQQETSLHEGSDTMKIFSPPVVNNGLKCGTFVCGGPLLSEVTVDD